MEWFNSLDLANQKMIRDLGLIVGSVLTGLALAWFLATLAGVITQERRDEGRLSTWERERRMRLREANAFYRWFESWMRELMPITRRALAPPDDESAESILAAPDEEEAKKKKKQSQYVVMKKLLKTAAMDDWLPEEFLAFKLIESFFIALALVAFLVLTSALLDFSMMNAMIVGIFLGLMLIPLYQLLAMSEVKTRAAKRLAEVKRVMPFAVDLISLMLEAGADFPTGLATFLKEKPGNALADEFAKILSDIEGGGTRVGALQEFEDRMNDPDVTEFIYAMTEGQTLGVPIAKILKEQAGRMRVKRSQWIEAAAGRAEVNIVFPGLVTMLACLLIVITPFGLAALMVDLPKS